LRISLVFDKNLRELCVSSVYLRVIPTQCNCEICGSVFHLLYLKLRQMVGEGLQVIVQNRPRLVDVVDHRV
jgi:hypothetical protein